MENEAFIKAYYKSLNVIKQMLVAMQSPTYTANIHSNGILWLATQVIYKG